MTQMFDKAELTGVRRTADGYLVADVRAARTGLQTYLGVEVGKPDVDMVVVYRPEEEVFAKDSMATLANRPITSNHPPEMVNAANWKKYAAGITGGGVARDGEFLVVPFALMDESAIADVEAGKRELSAGYTCDLDFTPGVTADGHAYGAVQRNIRINHLAVVDKGRAGKHCRVGDTTSTPTEGSDMNLQKVMFDGLEIEVTPQGAQAIAKLQQQVSDADATLSTMKSTHAATLADKDKQLGEKDAEIAKLKGDVLDAAALDAKVRERADVVARGVALGLKDDDLKGKSNDEIVAAAVAKAYPSMDTAGRSADYLKALFDNAQVKGDPVRDQLAGAHRNQQQTTDADKAYGEMLTGLNNRWEGKANA